MLTTFSSKLTGYFAALFIASMFILFVIWYFGISAINLKGVSRQEIDSAIQLLEVKADLHQKLISNELKERRGDILVIAESDDITNSITKDKKNLQKKLEKKFESLLRAYPDRFKKMLIIDPTDLSILASTDSLNKLSIFKNNEFFNRAIETNHNHLIDTWIDTEGNRVLAMAHKIYTRNKQGLLQEQSQGILIAVINLKKFFEDGFKNDKSMIHIHGQTILQSDKFRETLVSFPSVNNPNKFNLNSKAHLKNESSIIGIPEDFEGTRIEKNEKGESWVVVYRKLKLEGNQNWTIIHRTKKESLLLGLHKNVNKLFAVGAFITLLALSLIWLISRRLARPLHVLTNTAIQLGNGNLYMRAEKFANEAHEIRVLSHSFNEMARSIQNSQKSLEEKVISHTEKLKRAEAMHFTLFNASADAIVVMDSSGIIDCNPATLAMFGASDRSQILNKKLNYFSSKEQEYGESNFDFVDDHWHSQHFKLQNSEHYFMHWVFSKIDTHENFSTEIQISRVKHAGQLLYQATVKDISERDKVEIALKESEYRHRTLVEWSPEGINVHRHGRLVYVNSSAVKMIGAQSAEELIGRHVTEFLHPDDYQTLDLKIEHVNADNVHAPSVEARFIRCDGKLIDVVAQALLIPFDGQKSFYVAWHDVTEKKKYSESVRIAATVFESQEGMLVLDCDWTVLRVNQSFSEITGYEASEVVGKLPYFFDESLLSKNFIEDFYNQLSENGVWQGEVINKRKNGHLFPAWVNISSVKNDEGNATHYVGTFSDITERKAIEDEIRNLAFYDPLTQLPNRRLLLDRLKQAIAISIRNNMKGALLFIDLDNFKMLNDTLGHDKGDQLLQIVAERLLFCTRDGDTVARLGGDEFVVMLEGLDENVFEAAKLAEIVSSKIISELNQPYWLGLHEHRSSPSIGVTIFSENPESIEEPLKRADLAMYQAKASGRNTVKFFDPKMQLKVSMRADMEENLRDAMMTDQFELFYQGQITDKNKLFGAEVLMRWNHPTKGMISPLDFITLAEETGLISILGYWVLDTACRQLVKWSSLDHLKNICISVNVSPNQFHQSNFVDQVLDILEFTGANPQRLKLELTEGFSIADIEDVIYKMTVLKEKGIGLSLDDFGTGYSSLSYLKRLPLEQLKIDQSFVRDILIDPNDAAISKMVIVLAESLGLNVIAEGVETFDQKTFLANYGCHLYQGYLFSEPLPLEQFEAFAQKIYLQ